LKGGQSRLVELFASFEGTGAQGCSSFHHGRLYGAVGVAGKVIHEKNLFRDLEMGDLPLKGINQVVFRHGLPLVQVWNQPPGMAAAGYFLLTHNRLLPILASPGDSPQYGRKNFEVLRKDRCHDLEFRSHLRDCAQGAVL
jgi:hypothetical protein